MDLSERVARGAEWLDTNVPRWIDRVDLHTLRLEDGCRCVLGQVFATHFSRVHDRVTNDWLELANHGFCVYLSPGYEEILAADKEGRPAVPLFECDPDALREEWVTLILSRRHQQIEHQQDAKTQPAEVSAPANC